MIKLQRWNSRKVLLISVAGLIAAVIVFSPLQGQGKSPEELLRQAKVSIFDERWQDALALLQEIQACCPSSSQASPARFYQARVLDSMGRRVEALESYSAFLNQSSHSKALEKEAQLAVVKLSARLWQEGQRQFIGNTTRALNSPDPDLRLLAGVQLSYLHSKELQDRAVPVLQKMARDSDNAEMQNQATLALLRIDPKLLQTDKKGQRAESDKRVQRLHISVTTGGTETFSLALPASLIRLVFSSLSDGAKRELEQKGIDANNLLEQLREAGEVLEIKGDSETLRLWVE